MGFENILDNGSMFGTAAAVIVGIVVLLGCVMHMWKKVPQDKAMVVTGLRKRVITGHGGLVIPGIERCDTISLSNIQMEIKTENGILSKMGVPVNIVAAVIIKVKNDETSILSAIEQFSGRNPDEVTKSIKAAVNSSLEGKLREIVSKMTVEEINEDREQFGSQVQDVVGGELGAMGLEIKIFTIKEITDENGYMDALGAKSIAEKLKEASIAKAEAEKEREQSVSQSKRDAREAVLKSETEIAEKEKDKAVRLSEQKIESEAARAKADAAYKIQQNLTEKDVAEAELSVEIFKQEKLQEVEKAKVQVQIEQERKNSELAQVKAERNKQQLRADVIEPALADKEKKKAEAEAEKYKQIQKAEADAESKKKQAEADAEQIKLTGEAEAETIRMKGTAEAEAIRLRGIAEAEAMEKKAEAYKQYNDAAVTNMLIDVLPKVAEKIAAPLSRVDKVMVFDGGSGKGGVSSIPGSVTASMVQVMEGVKEFTGLDIADMIKSRKTGGTGSNASDAEDAVQTVKSTAEDAEFKEVEAE